MKLSSHLLRFLATGIAAKQSGAQQQLSTSQNNRFLRADPYNSHLNVTWSMAIGSDALSNKDEKRKKEEEEKNALMEAKNNAIGKTGKTSKASKLYKKMPKSNKSGGNSTLAPSTRTPTLAPSTYPPTRSPTTDSPTISMSPTLFDWCPEIPKNDYDDDFGYEYDDGFGYDYDDFGYDDNFDRISTENMKKRIRNAHAHGEGASFEQKNENIEQHDQKTSPHGEKEGFKFKKDKGGFIEQENKFHNFNFPNTALEDGPVEIVGGDDTSPRKYKFFASLGGCGASLVAPNVVLTAAHCIGVSDTVTLGLHKIVLDDDEVEEFSNIEHIPIKQSIIHPCYELGTPTNYDFGIIELEWSTEKYEYEIVVLDAPADELDLDDGNDHELAVIGFGQLFSGGPGISPNTNQEVTLDYIPNDSCQDLLFPDQVTNNMLCAKREARGGCLGDSGGPVIDSVTNKQVGIVSWGVDGCASPTYPATVFARVSVGYEWINQHIVELRASIPAPEQEVCTDEPEGWFDRFGPRFNCHWYAADANRCFSSGENGGVTANDACCACAPLTYPYKIDGSFETGIASFDVTFGYNGSYGAAAHGLEPAMVISDRVVSRGSRFHDFDVSGAAVLRIRIPPEAVANPRIDLDLYLFSPENELVAASGNGGTNELVEVISPMDGTWYVEVFGYDTVGQIVDYDMYTWIVSATPGGNMSVDSSPNSALSGEVSAIDISWTGANSDEWHLGAISHTGKGIGRGLTLVEVDNRNRVPGYPNEVLGAGVNSGTTFQVSFDYSGAYAAAAHGLVPATVASRPIPRANGHEVHEFELSGAAFFRITIPQGSVANPDTDLDLYLLNPLNRLVAQSTSAGTDELIEVFSPMDGTWSVYVYGYSTNGSSANYDIYSWAVSATPGGNMSVDASPSSAVSGEKGTVEIIWADATEGEWHLGAVSHSDGTSVMALTFVNVDNRV